FNEALRLPPTIERHESYFGKCRQLGADNIYGTNANRRYCTGMTTTFVPKGRKPKVPDPIVRKLKKRLRSARAAHMEGAIGNEKLHYGLNRIKATRADTQKLWIHFGVWTASAVKIAKRIAAQELRQAA
ncbi:MAG: DDE transposase, partial [Cyanobacteria bacterium J06576_12]